MQDMVLTGDGPTGPLHIGHDVGSLKKRMELQHQDEKPYVVMADLQALTDNAHNPQQVSGNVLEVAYDYLAVGLKPELKTFLIQSLVLGMREDDTVYELYVGATAKKPNR